MTTIILQHKTTIVLSLLLWQTLTKYLFYYAIALTKSLSKPNQMRATLV